MFKKIIALILDIFIGIGDDEITYTYNEFDIEDLD